jgi:predicted acetyltransferase
VAIRVRPAADTDLPGIRAVDEFAFGFEWSDDAMATEIALLETDRTLVAESDGAIVGQASAFSLDVSIPGGRCSAAGVTWVAVHPAHRRRGALRSLMERQLADCAAGAEPIALLWSSEPGIYGRFGYGIASEQQTLALPVDARLLPAGQVNPVTAVEPAALRSAADSILDRVAGQRAGIPRSDQRWWDRRTRDIAALRSGPGRLRGAVAHDSHGEPAGYLLFSPMGKWGVGDAEGEVQVREMAAVDADAAAALWGFLMSLDLMATVSVAHLPLDDPVGLRLTRSRGSNSVRRDGLWCRILDLPEALSRRRYSAPVDVVLQVDDPLLPGNSGRWRLTGDVDGAECRRTSDAADLQLPIATMGAAYLGGTPLARSVLAGMGAADSAPALAAASTALRSPLDPWCPWVF